MNALKGNLIDIEDIRVIRKFLTKNWLLILALPLISGAIAYIYVHRLPDIYESKTEILLKANSELEYKSQVYTGLVGFYQNYADISNQTRVLKSYDLISKTLDKLDFDLSYYISGRVKTTQVERLAPFNIDIRLIDNGLYHQFFDIKVQNEDHYNLSFDLQGNRVQRIHPFGEEIIEGEYIIKVDKTNIVSPSKLPSIQNFNYQFVVNSRPNLVARYRSALSIENQDYTSILELRLQDELQQRSKTFLDSLASVYVEYTIEAQKMLNKRTTEYIDLQLREVSLVLDSIESELEKYKESKAILDLSREEEEFFTQLTEFEKQKRDLELRWQSFSSLEEYLLSNTEESLLPPALYISDDDFLKNSLNKLYELQFEKNKRLYNVTGENYKIQSEDITIEEQRKDILLYIKDSQKAITDKIDDVQQQLRLIESRIKTVPASERDIININRKLKVNEEMYLFLLEKRANSEIAKAAIIPQTSIIEKARPLGKVGPEKPRYLFLFIGGGFLLALLLSFVRFSLFDRIENVRELKNVTKLPILGGVPSISKDLAKTLFVNSPKRLNVIEAFRAIRTNLQYLNRTEQNKVILLTSLHPGEGKTFGSVNVAGIIAKAGKKVLLLDFDLHKPKVHRSLGLDNSLGITSILTNDFSFNDVLKDTEIEGLKVITCGPPPPNPSEMILSEKVKDILKKGREEFDYVIIDTPPILLISDALVLRSLSDIGIYVLNTMMATKAGIKHLEEIMENNQIGNNSLILNNIKRKTWKYYPYKYQYSYDYGYGYSYTYSSYIDEKAEA